MDPQLGPLTRLHSSVMNISQGGRWLGPFARSAPQPWSIPSLACVPLLPKMTLYSFILLVQVSAKGTQMEREKSGLGLDRKKKFTECQYIYPGKKP